MIILSINYKMLVITLYNLLFELLYWLYGIIRSIKHNGSIIKTKIVFICIVFLSKKSQYITFTLSTLVWCRHWYWDHQPELH